MAGTEKAKDWWDKADVIGKWLTPLAVVVATFAVNAALREREAKMKTFEVAVSILQSPDTATAPGLRDWALVVFRETTGAANAELPPPAVRELERGHQIPASQAEATAPAPAPARIRIMRLAGAPSTTSQALEDQLRSAGHSSVSVLESAGAQFPTQSEVRFYHGGDEAAAVAVRDFLAARGIVARLNDRSADDDASRHRLGDIHIYLR